MSVSFSLSNDPSGTALDPDSALSQSKWHNC